MYHLRLPLRLRIESGACSPQSTEENKNGDSRVRPEHEDAVLPERRDGDALHAGVVPVYHARRGTRDLELEA